MGKWKQVKKRIDRCCQHRYIRYIKENILELQLTPCYNCPRSPLLSATPAVTFPAREHHHPLTGTKLYCLVTEAICVCVCMNNLPRVVNWRRSGRESTFRSLVRRPNHYTTKPGIPTNFKHLNIYDPTQLYSVPETMSAVLVDASPMAERARQV